MRIKVRNPPHSDETYCIVYKKINKKISSYGNQIRPVPFLSN